jgi:hypothetical protein
MRGWLVLALAACGGGGSSSMTDAAGDGPGIVAPSETWTWIPVDGMQCGNGGATGIGVNLTDRSDKVMIFLQGGGACWDAATCFVVKSAVNIESGYTEASFTSEIAQIGAAWVWQRNALNPFRDASWIYVPYCTGDLHDGTRTATYDVSGVSKTVAHVGALNYEKILARVHATRPAADTIWLTGLSAGAYGVGFNIAATRAAWPNAEVHGLADSSPLIKSEPTRWQAMQTQWAMRFPAACSGCPADLGAMPAALQAEAPAGTRYGLLSYTRDNVISTYFGLTQDQFQTELDGEVASLGTDQAAFLIVGTSHVLIGNPTLTTTSNVVESTWVTQWAVGDTAWTSVGP